MNTHPLSVGRIVFKPSYRWNSNPKFSWVLFLCIFNSFSYPAKSSSVVLSYDRSGNLTAVQAASSGVPVILSQPFTQVEDSNALVSISVNVASDTPVSYQWQFNGQNVAGATSATLLLQSVAAANSGSYTVIITNASGSVTSNAVTFIVGLPPNMPLGFEEGGPSDWAVDGGVWEFGAPTSGPNAAHSGINCVGTVLNGNYPNSADSRLLSPSFVVPIANQNPRLRFWHWFETFPEDQGRVEVRPAGASTWTTLSPTYFGNSDTATGAWTRTSVDLSAYAGQTIQVAFHFTSNGSSNATGWYVDEVMLETGALQPLVTNVPENFEAGLGDWYAERGTWEVGVPKVGVGPGAAHSGANCTGTLLKGNYPNSADSRLISPPFAVPSAGQNPRLRFWHWFETFPQDQGKVEVRPAGASTWTTLSPTYFGNSDTATGAWTRTSVDLSAYAGQTIQVAFHFTSNGSSNATGWYVDEVTLVAGAVQTLVPNVPESFEAGLGDWYAERGTWEVGVPKVGVGPGAAHSGTNCAGTILKGNYPNAADSQLISPSFMVPDAGQNPRLGFWHWFSTFSTDLCKVEVRPAGSSTWTAIPPTYFGNSGGWTQTSVDLGIYAGQTIQVAFHFTSDSGSNAAGWYVDEVPLVTGAVQTLLYTDALIAWWPGEGSAQDAAGTHHGTGGTTYTSGKVGQTFSLNGTTATVQVPDSPDWAFGTGDFTIELWAKFGSASGSRVFVASDQGGGSQNKWIFWLNGGLLQFHINGSPGSASIGTAALAPILNQWYHLAVTRSVTTYKFYVNGSVVSTNSDSRLIPDANAPLTIGSAEGQFFFDGQLDELSIYNQALSDADIAAINTAGVSGKSLTQLQLWRKTHFNAVLNEGSGMDGADPDFDGLANLMEFATNSIPTLSSSQPGQVVRNSSNIEFTYTRSKAAMSGGITFAVEWTDVLPAGNWSTLGVTETILDQDGTVQNVRASLPIGSSSHRFLHLRVTQP